MLLQLNILSTCMYMYGRTWTSIHEFCSLPEHPEEVSPAIGSCPHAQEHLSYKARRWPEIDKQVHLWMALEKKKKRCWSGLVKIWI